MTAAADVVNRVTIRNMKPDEYPAVKEIVGRSFEDHIKGNPGALEEYQDEPWYDPEHLLVADLDGQLVSQMGVRRGDLWISGRAIPAGLVGTVCTLPEHRGKGIGAIMLREVGQWMAARGIAMSYLHTSEARYAFYGRGGYRLSAIDTPRTMIRQSEGPSVEAVAFRTRPGLAGDASALNRIYRAHFGRLSGAWSRTDAFWQRRLSGRPKLWMAGIPVFTVAEDNDGRPVAYVGTVAGKERQLIELAAPSVHPLIRAVIGDSKAGIATSIGAQDPLRPYLEPFDPVDETSAGKVLVRIENPEAFSQAILPILEERAGSAGVLGTVTIRGLGETHRFGSESRPLSVALNQGDLAALVYNGRLLPELVSSGDVAVTAGEMSDLKTVFPDTHPARCSMDGY